MVSSITTLLSVVDPGEGLVDDQAPPPQYRYWRGTRSSTSPSPACKGDIDNKVLTYNKRGW